MPSRKNIDFSDILDRARSDDDVLAVALFGSVARDEPANDVDICIFLHPGQEKAATSKKMALLDLMSKYDIHFFTDLPLYIRARVMKECEFLLNKDLRTINDIFITTIKEYRLFEPHYKTYLEAVENG
jgi:predicted nucleotidyltransferase